MGQKGGAAGLGQENWRARSRDNFTWQTQAISLRAHDMPPLWSTKFYICFVFGYFVQKKSYPGRDKKQSKQKYALETLCDVWAFIKGAKSQMSTSPLYLPSFFKLHRLPCAWTSAQSQIIFSVLLWGTHCLSHSQDPASRRKTSTSKKANTNIR